MDDEFLTVAEVASWLRVSKSTVYRLIEAGHLAVIRVSRDYRIKESSFKSFVERGGVTGG
jgi:excisionase family DNA binding protein